MHILTRYPEIDYELLFSNSNNKVINCNQLNTSGIAPLHVACRYGNEKAVESLVKRGANVNLLDPDLRSPLQLVASTCGPIDTRLRILVLLVQYGADIHYKDPYNQNALHYAAHRMDTPSAKFLIDQGCDYRLLNVKGNTFLDLFVHGSKEKDWVSEYIALIDCR